MCKLSVKAFTFPLSIKRTDILFSVSVGGIPIITHRGAGCRNPPRKAADNPAVSLLPGMVWQAVMW